MLRESLDAPSSGVYVNQLCFTLAETLNVPALHQAMQELVDQHPLLRTQFIWQDKLAPRQSPLQLVRQHVELPWVEEHWEPGIDSDAALAILVAGRPPAWLCPRPGAARALRHLARDVAKTHFVWTTHHLIEDGWSTPLLLQ